MIIIFSFISFRTRKRTTNVSYIASSVLGPQPPILPLLFADFLFVYIFSTGCGSNLFEPIHTRIILMVILCDGSGYYFLLFYGYCTNKMFVIAWTGHDKDSDDDVLFA